MSLPHHLNRQQSALDALGELLYRERQALGQGQVDGDLLQRLAEDKQSSFTTLEKLERQRCQAQRALGYIEGHHGAEQAAQETGCLEQWQMLLESARRVGRLNELNGNLIHERMTHNQRMLNALHELRGDSLYNPAGQAMRRSGQHAYQA